ncbi:MAG TPA: zf-TFIIB domain-containing protein [Anaeromyxobacteraceae bacterium]|nr:zf-TFIIB domain-containing protein [Anaeromyxobacteraceae bacterium]
MSDRGAPNKPSQTEDEYFVREDAEKKRKLAIQVKRETKESELKALKDLHFMHCPKCGLKLQEVKFRGVDVDVCFACGGVFLDKGELEHIATKEETKGVMNAILNWFTPETKR